LSRIYEKRKLIKETVFNSIMLEINSKLDALTSDVDKKQSIEKFAAWQLHNILNSLEDDKLLPIGQVDSEKEFEKHILKIINICRGQLLEEIKREFP
jgi:hypothetical protein